MNFDKKGIPIAIIKSKEYDKNKRNPILFLSEDGFDDIQLEHDETFQIIPNTKTERFIFYVVGQSGSGKSYYCTQLLKEYNAIYPDRPIYMFSTVSEDSDIDKLKNFHRVILDDTFLEDEEIPVSEFKDSCCIFDDVDNISNRLLKKKIWNLMNSILQTGRHYNISCLITFHVATAGYDTKIILNEAHSIAFNIKTMGNKALKYLLDNYLGLDKDEIKKIKTLKGRMTTVMKTYPKMVVSEKRAYILN
jgi:hypothetical protein